MVINNELIGFTRTLLISQVVRKLLTEQSCLIEAKVYQQFERREFIRPDKQFKSRGKHTFSVNKFFLKSNRLNQSSFLRGVKKGRSRRIL